MSRPIRRPSSRSLNRLSFLFCGEGTRESGYALLILMMMVTVLLVSLTVALPSVYLEGQRQKEEELIFRGMQYARAIALFRRQFNRFPASVDELVKTNGIRFLRHAYPDPMSRSGKWRFIHANAAGVVLDSKTQPRFGGVAGPGSSPSPSASPLTPSTGPTSGTQGQAGNAPGTASSFFGDQTARGPTGSVLTSSNQSDSFFSPGTQGTFIVGIASSSTRESVRVWNNRTHYDEWEFLGIGNNVVGFQPNLAPQPTAPAQPGSFGQPRMMPQQNPQPGAGQPFSLR
jgi:type II secretory pathway pseudopilin PulG